MARDCVNRPPENTATLELAIAKAHELRLMLEELPELPENGPGSCVEDAYERLLDCVIGTLEPLPPEVLREYEREDREIEQRRRRPKLRVVGGTEVYHE